MKHSLILFVLQCMYSVMHAQPQVATESILRDSKYIFEAVPVSGQSYFDPRDSAKIYTSYILQVTKVYKGADLDTGSVEMLWEGGYVPRYIRMPNGKTKNLVGNGKGPIWTKIVQTHKRTVFFCKDADIAPISSKTTLRNPQTLQPTAQEPGNVAYLDEKINGKSHVAIGIPSHVFDSDAALASYLKTNKISVPQVTLAATGKSKRRDVASSRRP